VQSIFYEISDRKKSYDELEQAKIILELIGKNSADIVFKYDLFPKEHYSYISESAQQILGYSPKDWYKQKDLFQKILHHDNRRNFPTKTKDYIKYVAKNERNTAKYIS